MAFQDHLAPHIVYMHMFILEFCSLFDDHLVYIDLLVYILIIESALTVITSGVAALPITG